MSIETQWRAVTNGGVASVQYFEINQGKAVEELPMGYQLQLDFGMKTVRDAYSNRYIKLHFVVFTLYIYTLSTCLI